VIILILILFLCNESVGQSCNCDSLIENKRQNWSNWVKNSDTIKIVQIKKLGTIKTEKNKKDLFQIFNSDTSWVSYPESGKSVFVKLARLDTVAGKFLKSIDQYGSESRVYFPSKKEVSESLKTYITINDEYYEIYFAIGNRIIISPIFCIKRSCIIMDHIISPLFINE